MIKINLKKKHLLQITFQLLFQILGDTAKENISTIETYVHLLREHPIVVSKIIYSMCRLDYSIKALLSNASLMDHIVRFSRSGYNHCK